MRLALAAAVAISLVCAAPAAAVDRYVPMKAPPAAGPAKYDRVWVQQLGPRDASQVLVLVPGTQGGAGSLSQIARDIIRRVPSTQVWIVDRREQALEDTSVFQRADPDAALDYYLGFHYRSVKGTDAKFAAEWGLATQLRDLRGVVRRAHAGGRRVILGGHSAGASTAVAYAAWDFGGHPGYQEIDGLVLIDGGLLGSFNEANLKRAKSELADIRGGNVFIDLLGAGIPEIAGIFDQIGAMYAYQRPDVVSTLQTFPLLPANLKPSFPVTNEGLLGFVFDKTTSPLEGDLHIHAGQLATSGDPRGWEDGELTPIRRFARIYAANRPNATEWYYPRRLLLDIDAANDLRQNAAAGYLGLRLEHARQIDVPLYAFSTDLTNGRVARGARRLARISHIPRSVVIDDRRTSHLDPVSAAPKRNHFLKTVVPFLRSR